jgi:kynurenine 3-monooxygenase
MLSSGRLDFSRSYAKHLYKELSIPPRSSSTVVSSAPALLPQEGLHIWPRGEFMLIALPNLDCSFTATLFFPSTSSIASATREEASRFFAEHFPDLQDCREGLAEDFLSRPAGSLVSVNVRPWHSHKACLVGDAAHAVWPFLGQGMNCGLEDVRALYNMLAERASHGEISSAVLMQSVEEYAAARARATDVLAELCRAHYEDMASSTRSALYLAFKQLENWVHRCFPRLFSPLYSMIAFSDLPYDVAVEQAKRQEKVLVATIGAVVVAVIGVLASLLYKLFYA